MLYISMCFLAKILIPVDAQQIILDPNFAKLKITVRLPDTVSRIMHNA